MTDETRRVGLVPAAGRGSRIRLPFSKELYPVRFGTVGSDLESRPITALELLLDQFANGGAQTAFVVIRDGKWDIPRHLGTRTRSGLELAYLIIDASAGVPYSLDMAHGFLDDALVLMGFPDVLIEPDDAFAPVVDRLEAGNADVVLGLFPALDPPCFDQVALDRAGRVVAIRPKPVTEPLDYAWAIAAWRPGFTQFLHDRTMLMTRSQRPLAEDGREYSVGHAIADALKEGLVVEGVLLEGGSFLDIGTPQGLASALSVGLRDSQTGTGRRE